MQRAVILAICATALGCGHKRDDAPPPAPSAPPAGLHVVDPGAEPRALVRYKLAAGTASTIEVTSDIAVDQTPWPTVHTTSTLAATAVAPDGTATVRYSEQAASAADRANTQVTAAQMAPALQDAVGTTITGTLTPTGHLGALAIDTGGKQLPPALAQQVDVLTRGIDRMVMPLPDVPIGTGAKWTFVQPLDQTGMKLEATTTIQATAITPTQLTIALTSTMTGPDQDTTAAGPKVRITGLGGTMTASGTIDLTRATLAGTLEAKLTMKMTADGQTEAGEMTTKLVFAPRAGIEPTPAADDAGSQGAQNAP